MTLRAPRFFLVSALLVASACGDDSSPGDTGTTDSSMDGMTMCPSGSMECDGACVDVTSDRTNCGTCGTTCDVGESCTAGSCGVLCPGDQVDCAGACADTSSDRSNCGSCGMACASGEICTDGSCELSCPAGQTVCGSACANTQADPANCGTCGTACDAGEVCSEGACAANCGADLVECGGACVSTADDPANCGMCGMACSADTGAFPACSAGACRQVCGPGVGDCNGDLGQATSDGCETALATDAMNCGSCNTVCTLDNATSGCDMGGCVVSTCDAGFDNCDGMAANGCESVLASDRNNCGACGTVCPMGERCETGACIPAVGEDCDNAFALSTGSNSISWAAATNDYLTGSIPCSSSAADGPDVVLSYTATRDELVMLDFDKPTSTRWAAVVSTATCGMTAPRVACLSEFSADSMVGEFVIASGQTAYVYVVDTTSGTAPLDNPLLVDVSSVACTDPPPATLEPATGTMSDSLSPTLTATFGAPILTTSGVFTITGNMGSSVSYDVSTSPAEISFSSGNTVVEISPSVAFLPGEQLSISWTGVRAVVCTTAVDVPSPTWIIDIVAPPCIPGMGGVVGTTTARIAAPSAIGSEYYVVADENPSGFVYFGGTFNTYRMPKAGGVVEDVEAAASLTSSQQGYTMIVNGLDIFSVNETTTSTTGRFFRISSDGGATWLVEDFATFSPAPADDFRGVTLYGGRFYFVTEEDTTGVDTEIWSVSATPGALPATAVLERTVSGEGDCNAITRDDTYYYLACDENDRLVRVPVAGGASELISDSYSLSFTKNELHGDDTDGDGDFDVLYLQIATEQAFYVCSPADAAPFFSDTLVNEGTGTSNYGLGFDQTGATLYLYDDDTDEIISVQ